MCPKAATSLYTAANIATDQVQGRLEPSMLKNLLPAPWSRCRSAGDYAPLMVLNDIFGVSDSVKSAAQYCATQLSVDVLDNLSQPKSSLTGLGGVAAGQNQTTGSVQVAMDDILRLSGPIRALGCPAGVGGSEELVVRFAGVQVRRLSAAPYLANSLSLNISDLRTAASLASGNTDPQPLTIERTGAPCGDYWGAAPVPLVGLTMSFQGPGKIAFERNSDVYVMNADGSGQTLVYANPYPGTGTDRFPIWSPDGRRLLFREGTPLPVRYFARTINADGSGVVDFMNGDYGTTVGSSWSPDGTRFAFYDIGVTGISIFDTVNLTTTPLPYPLYTASSDFVAWSPDGQRILATHYLYSASTGLTNYSLKFLSVDGSGVTTLPVNFYARFASWSPDGTQIALAITELGATTPPTHGTRIMVMNADGSAQRTIPVCANGIASGGSWSPDGKKLVFECYTTGQYAGIYSVNLDGTGLTYLADGNFPTWSRR